MLFKLFLLFVLVPLVELFLLFRIADLTSPEATLALVIATGFVGSILARSQGVRTYTRIREELASSRMPTDSLVDAVMIFIAGALLLTPGILTDLFGFSLLVPICRRFYRVRAKAWFQTHFKVQGFGRRGFGPQGDGGPQADSLPGKSEVIDSYVVDTREKEES